MQKWVSLFEYNFFSLRFHSWPRKKKQVKFFFIIFFLGKKLWFFLLGFSFYLQAIVPIPNPNPDGPKFFP